MATGGARSSGISAHQLNKLMASTCQGIEDEMVSRKRELSTEQEAADNKLLKRIKLK